MKYIKNVSQLLLVLQGIHSLYLQLYAESPRTHVSVSHLFSEGKFKLWMIEESSNKANAIFLISYRATLCAKIILCSRYSS